MFYSFVCGTPSALLFFASWTLPTPSFFFSPLLLVIYGWERRSCCALEFLALLFFLLGKLTRLLDKRSSCRVLILPFFCFFYSFPLLVMMIAQLRRTDGFCVSVQPTTTSETARIDFMPEPMHCVHRCRFRNSHDEHIDACFSVLKRAPTPCACLRKRAQPVSPFGCWRGTQ